MIYLSNDSKSLFFYKGTSRKDLAEGFRGRISSIVARFCGRIPRKDPRKDSWKDPFRCYLKNNFFSFRGFPSTNPSEILPQNPSADPSAESFHKILLPLRKSFRGILPRILPQNPSTEVATLKKSFLS